MLHKLTDFPPRGADRAAPRWLRPVVAALMCVITLAVAPAAPAQDDSQFWYETDALNSGLQTDDTTPPDRSAPRQTIRGFVAAADRGDYGSAAHYLNLSRIPPEQQEQAGRDAARKLASIMERQVWIDWSDLSARPDAMIERRGGSSSRSGDARRDIQIETLQTGGTAYDLRIARYRPPEGDALWLFTPQTVDNIAPLFDAFGPRPYERFIPDVLKYEIMGLWLWEWIALPLLALCVIGLGWVVQKLVFLLAQRAPRNWLRNGLQRSRLPVALLVMAGVTQVILNWVLSFSGPVQAFLQPVLIIVMVWGVGMTALRILDAILHKITLRYVGEIDDKRGVDERAFYTSIYALRRLIVLATVGIAAIIVLVRLNLFDSIGMTLLASAGVLTVVLGIAGQAVLGNIIASLQIAFAKPVRIGDAVFFEGEWAYVESIFYTFLRLRTWDKRRIVVPVTYFVSKPFENWSVTEARMMRVIDLWLDPRADVSALRRSFERMLEADPDIDEAENSFVYATDQSPDGFKISFYAMMPDPSTGWTVQSRLREQLMACVRDEHPEWIARERVLDAGSEDDSSASKSSRAVGAG
ncbi:mechanosensitive ion channel domain-containing protein [Maritimibacter sp. UBA3975]|uniref:mechanosensitive ion channel family protein n=1 Tax=Maritimibacter sp. UBA3975 TaxID=1946833 RepID=UPI0025BCDC7B|nr:mechanosensitive ion channel domain-containing protein [Maritimibacter sp. UBA3975]